MRNSLFKVQALKDKLQTKKLDLANGYGMDKPLALPKVQQIAGPYFLSQNASNPRGDTKIPCFLSLY